VPKDVNYEHDEAWHDGNGYSHVRAALLKTSLVVPLVDSRLMLGTWQQIVYIDFDNRPRKREIIVQIIGE
jgi:secondary thiamine-phosphate synthase enzyme